MAFGSRRPPPFHERNGSSVPAPARAQRWNPQLQGPDVFITSPNQQVQTESSSDDDVQLPKPTRSSDRPAHARSMSHPFPSLFGSKKSKKLPSPDETTDDDFSKAGHASSRPAMASKKPHRGPIDFSSGNCMTCGGKVRWPKELSTFRCTICATINDLTPHGPRTEEGKSAATARPLSLEHTRRLVRQCLLQALKSFTGAEEQHLSPGLPTRQSSLRTPEEGLSTPTTQSQHGRSPSLGVTPPDRDYNPVFDDHGDGCLDANPLQRANPAIRSYSTSYPDGRSLTFPLDGHADEGKPLDSKRIFKPIEDYLIRAFQFHTNINTSFIAKRHSFSSRAQPQPQMRIKRKPVPLRQEKQAIFDDTALVADLDPKMLMVGDLAENAQWWAGGQQEAVPRSRSQRKEDNHVFVSSRSPRIDWGEVLEWYTVVTDAAKPWTELYKESLETGQVKEMSWQERQRFEATLLEAQSYLQRVLLKCTEMLLKRPGRLLEEPQDVRFLLLLVVNPLLASDHKSFAGVYQDSSKGKQSTHISQITSEERSAMGRHSGIIKRILGLISNSSDQCHHQLVAWFSKLPGHLFLQTKDLINTFVNYRLRRLSEKKFEVEVDLTGGLIPDLSNSRTGASAASLHAALAPPATSRNKKQSPETPRITYSDDWQLKAGAKVMALIFAANNQTHVRRNEVSVRHAHDHLLPTSDFYNTMLDCLDFRTDFEMWESRKGKFAFCQYPFFLSISAKIQILEFDAKRQMHGKARDAFFDSLLTHKNNVPYLLLSVRRECLIEDSLAKVSEVVGSGSEDIKKGLRVEFRGEEGVDAGGLRKEWFQLLVKEVFNPDHGLFVFDEDSQFCYFNPHTFETTDQYFLVGVVLGLAIYNSAILDVAFPPFAFRKLLAAAPASSTSNSTLQRQMMTYTLDDLAEFRPRLAHGLRQLLDFEGDVENTFCLDFVVEIERYDTRSRTPLCPGGDTKPVTNANRREYVDLYVKYLLDEAVKRQFEPFKRGFFTVCAGNALSLFRPEEIELLVRGSDEPLDITSLRAVAKYADWNTDKLDREPANEPTIDWFWESFAAAPPKDQRRLLSFITGSDRIPAMGATSLVIKISCLGADTGRYPTARTCFNVINLFRYRSRERLETLLWRAVNESEGFGLR
ncbi:hypothetical protein BKA67DRAFT_174401 [Truncatella angustata]|uniref:HECT-type E3 ubiquitin transferase n=1 Tax=Truncatella angustata TaxID=152316 RepID=A0A9P8URK6_9PEZI|nr:uncharacterized protein BKA67DRAFT_174401 [Truncatella angustata]KAH6656911.1 hypothetical protein BKA67DRAFT_174401 [Truncatella angustata]